MTRAFKLASITLALVLGGCNSINSSSFRDMSSAYRDVLEGYSNDNILLNVVRASERMPVSFLEMPSVVGTGNVSAGAGVSSIIYSATPSSVSGFFSAYATPFSSYYSPNLSLSVNNGFTFTQSSMDNSSFMNAFLTDIKVETVASLSNNVVAPKEVLYSLIIDSIEVRDQKNQIVATYENNPNLADYADTFQKALYTLVNSGLSTQQVVQKVVLSPPMDAETLNKQFGVMASAFSQPGFSIDVIKKTGQKDMYQAVRMAPTMQFCFNQQLSTAIIGQVFSDSAYCTNVGKSKEIAGSKPVPTNLGLAKTDQKVDLFIKLRSSRTVFDYLGAIVNLQHQNPARMITVMSHQDPSKSGAMSAATPSFPLFVVEKNNSTSKPISVVSYGGNTYSVPRDSASWTKDVLVTVSQLLTLNKVPGSIPPSPSVLVK